MEAACYWRLPPVIRDMDLVRDILFRIEQNPQADRQRTISYYNSESMGLASHPFNEVKYHFEMLVDGGYVDGAVGPDTIQLRGLTMSGHDFLANISSDDVWSKVKEKITDLPRLALPVINGIAQSFVLNKLGLK